MNKKLINFVAKQILEYTEGKKTKSELIKKSKTIISCVRHDLAEKLKKGGYL